MELAPSTSACFDDTDSAVLARLRRHACDISHLHFEDAAWTLPALGPYLSILNHISTLELDVNNAAEFVSNALKVVVPTVDELVLRFLKGPSWAKPIFSVIKERHPAVTVLELESPRTATLGSLTAARGKPTAAEGFTDTGDKAKLPLRRVVGSINDLWVHGKHFKGVEVEIRSLVGWSEAREKLGKSLPFMQGTQCIKINLTSGESQALSDFILFLPMLYQNANFHTKASRIEIYLKGDRVMEFAHSISGFFVSIPTFPYLHYLSQSIRMQKNVQCVIYKMLRPAGLFRSSLHYDSDHEKSNCSCEEATFIYQQVANGAEKWEAITKTGRNFRIKLEVSTSCLVSHSIEMKY